MCVILHVFPELDLYDAVQILHNTSERQIKDLDYIDHDLSNGSFCFAFEDVKDGCCCCFWFFFVLLRVDANEA